MGLERQQSENCGPGMGTWGVRMKPNPRDRQLVPGLGVTVQMNTCTNCSHSCFFVRKNQCIILLYPDPTYYLS